MSNNLTSLISNMYKQYQDGNPEKFNEKLIYLRRNENLDTYINNIMDFKLHGVKYIEHEIIHDESEFSKYIKTFNNVEKSKLSLIRVKYNISYLEESKDVEIYFYYPKLVDDYFFIINGIKYFSVYQITDKHFYVVRNGIYLKTLLMPLGVKTRPLTFTSNNGYVVKGDEYCLDYFVSKKQDLSKLKNLLYYFYINFGFNGTLDFFNIPKDYIKLSINNNDEFNYESFKIGKIFINIHIELLNKINNDNNVYFNNMIITILQSYSCIKRLGDLNVNDDVSMLNFWKKQILPTKTTNLEKADKSMFSLNRLYEKRISEFLSHKLDNIFDVIKYMVVNYDEIRKIDNVNIYNRRLRLHEYLLYPLIVKFSEASYRILNSKNMSISKLESIFRLAPNFLIQRMVKNELIRYNNSCNTLDLFNVILKWSVKGPQSISLDTMSVKFKTLHESYIGNLCLNASNASDPGVTGSIVPFCDNINYNNMFFIDKNNNKTIHVE